MARTGKWPARISLALSVAMIGALFSVISASGQQSGGAGILTVGIEVQSASITQATYAIVVRNQGTAPTTGVRVRSKIPTNTTFESSDPAPTTTTSPGSGASSCANGGVREPDTTTCEWTLGTLNAGETRTITAVYNLAQTNQATDRIEMSATATDNEQHSNSDTDESLVRQKVTPSDDATVDRDALVNTNYGACEYLRVNQGNRVTSFIDADSFGTTPNAGDTAGTTTTMETLYGAQLRLEVLDTTYTTQTPGLIGAHRITSGEWAEGTGGCAGATTTSTTEARTGGEPTSAASPTNTTLVSAAAQVVNWDVTADLDSTGERGSFQGWELRDQAATGTDNSTRFHSTEAPAAQQPAIFLVFTTVESPTCIDADPDAATTPPGAEHLMTAFVTDGVKQPTGTTPGSGTGPGGDACNGGPVATPVEWLVEDDTPDIYFSSQEGAPIQKVVSGGNSGPNAIETTADNNGLTGAGVRLEAPSGDNANRIEVRIKGATGDPDPPATTPPDPAQGACSPATVPVGKNCSGESAQFDDVTVTWSSSGSSGASTTTTTSGGTTSPGSTSPTSSGSTSPGSPSSSGSTSPSSASPSRSASTTPGTTGSTSSSPQSSRTVSLFATPGEVVFPGEVSLSGQIVSPDSSCEDAGEFVRIQRRLFGESQYSDFESRNTDAEGRFEVTFQATESAEYVAVAPRHDQCADASSSPESVLVKVKVTARAGRRSVTRGASVGIGGRVQPDHDGTTVILQRRKGSRFVTVEQAQLNVRSRFRFVIDAKWRGRRVFRVLWRSQDDNHETNNSRNVVIRTTRP